MLELLMDENNCCTLCKSENIYKLYEKNGFEIYKCKNCATSFVKKY